MDPFILVAGLLLIVFGTAAALAWWYLVKRAAPYRDEEADGKGGKRAGDGAEVIVLPSSGAPKSGGRSEG